MQQSWNRSTCIVGTREVLRAVEARSIRRAVLARDAEPALQQTILAALKTADIPYEFVPTMKELGAMCGIAVGAAVAGLVTDA